MSNNKKILSPVQFEALESLKKLYHAFPNFNFIILGNESGTANISVISNIDESQANAMLKEIGKQLNINDQKFMN